MHLRQCVKPRRWQAGTTGDGPKAKPFYFDCAGCAAKAPAIAGFISSAGPGEPATWGSISVSPSDPAQSDGMQKLLVYCRACWKKVQAANEERS